MYINVKIELYTKKGEFVEHNLKLNVTEEELPVIKKLGASYRKRNHQNKGINMYISEPCYLENTGEYFRL